MSEKQCSRRTTVGRLLTLASLSVAMMLAMSASSFGGGIQFSVETPKAPADAQMKDVVLVARAFSCFQPTDTKVSGTAEGLINGNRKSIALELSPIGQGVYAIRQQWPSEGIWVLALAMTATNYEMAVSALVELGPNGKVLPGTRLDAGQVKGVHARGSRRQLAAADIDSALRKSAGLTGETFEEVDRSTLSPFGPLNPVTWLLAGLGASVVSIGFITRARRRRNRMRMFRLLNLRLCGPWRLCAKRDLRLGRFAQRRREP